MNPVILFGACTGAGTITAALKAVQDERRANCRCSRSHGAYAVGTSSDGLGARHRGPDGETTNLSIVGCVLVAFFSLSGALLAAETTRRRRSRRRKTAAKKKPTTHGSSPVSSRSQRALVEAQRRARRRQQAKIASRRRRIGGAGRRHRGTEQRSWPPMEQKLAELNRRLEELALLVPEHRSRRPSPSVSPIGGEAQKAARLPRRRVGRGFPRIDRIRHRPGDQVLPREDPDGPPSFTLGPLGWEDRFLTNSSR